MTFSYREGDKITIRWELLNGCPATIRKVYSDGQISCVIDPQDLIKQNVPREATFYLHPKTGMVHLTLGPSEFEVTGRKIIIA
jgi:hypothetical protein